MENTEQIYRATPATSRKHPKRLTEYVNHLFERGRLLEAKHYFLELCSVSPNHDKTIRLGYAIAIATFDKAWILKYDSLLTEAATEDNEILWFRLRYYHSQNNISGCEAVCCHLLEKRFNSDHFSTVLEVCIERRSFVITEHLARHLAKNRITLTDHANTRLKKIVITTLIEVIQRRK